MDVGQGTPKATWKMRHAVSNRFNLTVDDGFRINARASVVTAPVVFTANNTRRSTRNLHRKESHMEPTTQLLPEITPCFCPRHGAYFEAGDAEDTERRMASGEVIRECLACTMQRLYETRRDGR